MGDDSRPLLARAWDDAADGYERYFVPRFAPWVETATGEVTHSLPEGPVLVPCCGTFPELPALIESQDDREVVGIDVSAGMVRIARDRAARSPQLRVEQGDAASLDPRWSGRCAGVLSVFGLQQLPDPEATIASWTGALRPGGRLSVMYWPDVVERDGPFAVLGRVLEAHREPADASWEDRLGEVVSASGATVERDTFVAFEMTHPDAGTFWDAMAGGGPLRAFALRHDKALMDQVERRFLQLAPEGTLVHRPRARWIVARREFRRQ